MEDKRREMTDEEKRYERKLQIIVACVIAAMIISWIVGLVRGFV